MDGKRLRLRYGAACAGCGVALRPGTEAFWYRSEREALCLSCAAARTAPPSNAPRTAGESAQAEYERREKRDRKRARSTRTAFLVFLFLAPIIGYGLTRLGVSLLTGYEDDLVSSIGGTPDPNAEPVIDAATAHTYGLYGALAVTLLVLAERLRPRQTTEAWRTGAEGERKTGAILDRLLDGYIVIHDLRMPGGRGNIDHVVIGPTGVFNVETKNYKNGVTIRGGVPRSNGRRLDKVVDQAQRQSNALNALTQATVTPIVCVHGGVEVGWFQKPTVDGVRFCSGKRLRKVLVEGPNRLTTDEVHRIGATLGSSPEAVRASR